VDLDRPEKNGGFFVFRVADVVTEDGSQVINVIRVTLPHVVDIRDYSKYKAHLVDHGRALLDRVPAVPFYLLHEHQSLFATEIVPCVRTEQSHAVHAVCASLKTRPTLEVLQLSLGRINPSTVPAVITSQIQALLDMMRMNMSILKIHLHDQYLDHDFFRGSVIPYLETNRLRPRVRAIQTTRPIPYRAGVLGRALLAARSDANSFWMLLSGNAEVAFPSRTTTIAVAASHSTFATAAAIATTEKCSRLSRTCTLSTLKTAAQETAAL
jgi:hypothetical protein